MFIFIVLITSEKVCIILTSIYHFLHVFPVRKNLRSVIQNSTFGKIFSEDVPRQLIKKRSFVNVLNRPNKLSPFRFTEKVGLYVI